MKKLILSLLLVVLCMSLFALDKWIPHNLLSGDGTSENPYLVEDFADLTTLSTTSSYWASGTYIQQTGVIDASESSTSNGGEGFIPIGNSSSPFFGNYDGQDFAIQNLTIDRAANQQGLFGFCINASISNVSLLNADISGTNYVGAIVGQSSNGLTLNNCSVQGSVTGTQDVGGIAGSLGNSSMTNCSMIGTITGNNKVGGCLATATNTTIRSCSSAGSVSRLSEDNTKLYWGGIVAFSNFNSDISLCTSSATITGNYYSGGIGGYLASTSVDSCYASGDVIGGTRTGGLIGNGYQLIYVKDSFASGNVTSYDQTVGGFAGSIDGTSSSPAVISNCYSLGDVEGGAFVSGFISGASNVDIDNCYSVGEPTTLLGGAPRYGFGMNSGNFTCDNSFWDYETAQIATSAIGVGLSTEEMKTLSTFTNATWDFLGESINGDEDNWSMDASRNMGYPYLTWAEDLIPASIVCPHITTNILPTDGQWNEATDVSLSWDAIPQVVGFTRGYDVRVTIQVETEIDTIIGNVENEESRVAFSFTGLPGGELPSSAIVRWTVTPYYKINEQKSYPTTEPQEYMFTTNVEIQPEIPSETNPIAGISIDIPDNATPHVPVILENLPTEGFAYQPIAAFTYNFDMIGFYIIQIFYPELAEISHVYIGGTELDLYDGSSEVDVWLIMEGRLYIIYNYDGSKGNKDIVVTNNDDFTLPVELSSFNAITTADNFAQISWETASESNLLGYNIFRSENENQDNALRITATMITASNQAMGDSYSYTDDEVEMNTTYNYWLQSNDFDGTSQMFGPVTIKISGEEGHDIDNAILRTELYGNYPNPFNPETTISYSVSQAQHVRLEVYNMRGQLVKTLINEYITSPNTRLDVIWNGLDNNNNKVSSGIYLYKLITDNYSKTNKMILMK